MNICMLAPEFLPVWGGVGTYIVELIRHLPKDINIYVLAPWRERIGPKNISTGDYDLSRYFGENVTVRFITKVSDIFISNAQFQYACFKYVPKILKEEKIDLIHSHTANMPDLLLGLRKLNVPTVTTIHATIRGKRNGTKSSGAGFGELDASEKAIFLTYPFLRLAEDFYFSIKRYYITVSKWMCKQLEEQYPGRGFSSMPVIYNSIDIERFSSRSKSVKKVQSNMVLFTGRLVAEKGVRYIIEAIPRVLSEYPETLFTFIGPGDFSEYWKMLKKKEISESNFSFIGYLKESSDLVDFYRACDIYLAPTLYENLPIRVLEAMACEAPVIASNVCGIPEIIKSGENGLLIPPRSTEDLASTICHLLGDKNLRHKLGCNARRTVEKKFSWDTNIAHMVRVYESILRHA